MATLTAIATSLAQLWAQWQSLTLTDLRFLQADTALLAIGCIVALATGMLVLRSLLRSRTGPASIGLPALLTSLQTRSWTFVRHIPLVLMLAGLPWFAVALSDPHTVLTQRQEVSLGRRIAILIDASTSMVRPFTAPGLQQSTAPGAQATFFTTVRAAERFVELRSRGPYRDLLALIEFGDQAYIITPFTTDHDNLRLSLSLIGDFNEFMRFPDQGTVISKAVTQGISLFEMFDFLDASGNLMVLFSDGEDSNVITQGRRIDEVTQAATDAKVPIYFVRTRYGREFGALVSDEEWRDAVEGTGGRFYAASSEASVLQAVRDIDRLGPGRIELSKYVSQRPLYAPFTLVAVLLWSTAAGLTLVVPTFRRFP